MADFKKQYLQLVEYLKNGGVEMYKDFLCFCGRGNLLSFAVFNQMQIFYANSSATVLYGYDEPMKKGLKFLILTIFCIRCQVQGRC